MRYHSKMMSRVVAAVCVKKIEVVGLAYFVLNRLGLDKNRKREKTGAAEVGGEFSGTGRVEARTALDVPRAQCMGCGLCYSLCPSDAISMSTDELGFVPRIDQKSCVLCGKCYRACPGVNVGDYPGKLGNIEAVYVAHAKNPQIRRKSSSGGVCRSLLAALLEDKVVDKVIVTRAGDDPYRPETIVTSAIEDLYSDRLNSIYSPTSPLAALKELDENLKYAFVGLPCHVAGICLNEKLNKQIFVKIGVFCSHTPSFKFVDAFLRDLPQGRKVRRLNYRGEGWPGKSTVHFADGERHSLRFPAMWHKYNREKRFQLPRCAVCTYYSAEFADISIGDPWSLVKQDKDGSSLVFVRTPRGKECLGAAARLIHAREVENEGRASILEFHVDSADRKARKTAFGIVRK